MSGPSETSIVRQSLIFEAVGVTDFGHNAGGKDQFDTLEGGEGIGKTPSGGQ